MPKNGCLVNVLVKSIVAKVFQKYPQNGSLFWAPVLVPRMGTAPTTGDKVTPILGTRFGTQNEDPKIAKSSARTFCYEASKRQGA